MDPTAPDLEHWLKLVNIKKTVLWVYLKILIAYCHCTVQLAMKIPIPTVYQSSHKKSVFVQALRQLLILRLKKIAQYLVFRPNRTFGTELSKGQEYRYPTVTQFLNLLDNVCFSLWTSNPISLLKSSINITYTLSFSRFWQIVYFGLNRFAIFNPGKENNCLFFIVFRRSSHFTKDLLHLPPPTFMNILNWPHKGKAVTTLLYP
jgi:hypothetical protein